MLTVYLVLIVVWTLLLASMARARLRAEKVRWARERYARAFERLRAMFSDLTPAMRHAGAAMDALDKQLKNYGRASQGQAAYSDAVDAVKYALSSFPTQEPPRR